MKPQILEEIDKLAPLSGNIAVGTFTRNTSSASGDQTIVNVGFKPRAVIFLSVVAATAGRLSIGFSNGVVNKGINSVHSAVPDALSPSDNAINIRQGSGGTYSYTGIVKSFDSDGFTIVWTKGADSVSGETITVQYLTLR